MSAGESSSEPRGPQDHFSKVAGSYATFRPTYPRELFDFIGSIAPGHGLAWEAGAGSGQATLALAERFDRVIATDVSAEQISRAPQRANVAWHLAPSEGVPMIADHSVDLIAVAQALHWFDFERFYAECRRVSVEGGVLAAWSYGAPTMDGEVGVLLREFMYGPDAIGPYWPPERNHIHAEYRTIPFPFERIEAPRFELMQEWTSAQVAGYLRSMSATAEYLKTHSDDPVVAFEQSVASVWQGGEARRITWPLFVLAGRISH